MRKRPLLTGSTAARWSMPEAGKSPIKAAVIWIDWYAYHVARFRGMHDNPALHNQVRGIELVGGIGVHRGLKFREELPADLPIETLMPLSSWQQAGQLTLARKLWAALDRLDPGAVLVPGYYTLPAIAAALWAKLHRRASILMTESTADDHTRVWWKETFKSILIRSLFDWAVCGGEAHRSYLHQLSFSIDRIASSYDVVDNSFFAETAASLQSQARPSYLPERYFLYVGRLSPEKNVDGLLHAYSEYRKLGGTWSLVLVGAGPAETSLRDLAGKSGHSKDISFMGLKTYHELPSFYAFACCFVLPSTREPWGLVVNEAMASGLPVIVSMRCGCAKSLIDDEVTGLVFDPSDESALAQALLRVNSFDNDELSILGNNCKEKIGNFSPQTFGKEIEKVLAELP